MYVNPEPDAVVVWIRDAGGPSASLLRSVRAVRIINGRSGDSFRVDIHCWRKLLQLGKLAPETHDIPGNSLKDVQVILPRRRDPSSRRDQTGQQQNKEGD